MGGGQQPPRCLLRERQEGDREAPATGGGGGEAVGGARLGGTANSQGPNAHTHGQRTKVSSPEKLGTQRETTQFWRQGAPQITASSRLVTLRPSPQSERRPPPFVRGVGGRQ